MINVLRLKIYFQVFCLKKPNGKFKWVNAEGEKAELGPCVDESTQAQIATCKEIQLKDNQVKSGMEFNCKINASKLNRCCK